MPTTQPSATDDTPADPPAMLADAWARLLAGKAKDDHAFRFATLATADALGRADARTIVLRHVDIAKRAIDFQTDRRSPKFAGLQHGGQATWVFYDRADWLQLRIQTSVSLHTHDAIADTQWAAIPDEARTAYRATAPGAPLPSPERPPPDDSIDPRTHFVVVRGTIDMLEYLRRGANGWKRLRVTWPNGEPAWQWLAP